MKPYNKRKKKHLKTKIFQTTKKKRFIYKKRNLKKISLSPLQNLLLNHNHHLSKSNYRPLHPKKILALNFFKNVNSLNHHHQKKLPVVVVVVVVAQKVKAVQERNHLLQKKRRRN